MTDAEKKVAAFYDALPELKEHFTQAAARYPEHATLINIAVRSIDTLQHLPTDRARRDEEQQQQSVVARLNLSQLFQHLPHTDPKLASVIDEADRIITRHMKP